MSTERVAAAFPATPRRQQCGAAALTVTLLLFFAIALAAAYANRNLIVEQRASAANVRATVAFEAAEAGLEWAIAMLGSPQPLGDDCRPSSAAGARPFRERLLRYDAAAGQHLPRSWAVAGGESQPLRAACLRGAAGWTCSCPIDRWPALPDGEATAPTFLLQIAAPRPGLLRLTSDGCSDRAEPCIAGAGRTADARSQMQVTLALVGALRTRPLAPLTAAGGIDAGTAAIGLQNLDATSSGWLVHAGAAATMPAARLQTTPGGSAQLAIAAGDAKLAALGAERLFSRHFGLDKASWREQSSVQTLRCESECSVGFARAAAAAPLIWVDGDLHLAGPLTLGSAERPLAVAASGAIRLEGPLTMHGLLYGRSLRWDDAAPGSARLHGAAVVETHYAGNAAPDFVYDAAVLARLQHDSGSYVRLPGSWRDFQP